MTPRGTFYPLNYTKWRGVALEALAAQRPPEPISGPVLVGVVVVVEKPKKTVRLMPGGDVDNYAKSALDACTKAGVWKDDEIVKGLIIWKRWAGPKETPRVDILINPWPTMGE